MFSRPPAHEIPDTPGRWTTKVHALTDVIGRPYVPMLTAGNVSDVKAAPAFLEWAGRMRYLLADKGYDADRLRRWLRDAGAVPVIPGRRNRKRQSATTRTDTATATGSRTPFAVSKTSAASPPAMTNLPPTACQALRSQPHSPSGFD